MRTVTTTKEVFKYSELSDEAKHKALEDYCNDGLGYLWWDAVYEDAKSVAALMGLDIDQIYFSGFWSQGDGACFEGTYSYKPGSVKAIKEYAPRDKDLHQIAEELARLQRRHFYGLTASTKQRGYYQHSGCMAVEVNKTDGYNNDLHVPCDDEQVLVDLLRRFADWVYEQLRSEYDYLTSEEAFEEACEANGWEFCANGSLYF